MPILQQVWTGTPDSQSGVPVRLMPKAILLHLILIVQLLPTQSNDEVSGAFALVKGVRGDPMYYSLERRTSLYITLTAPPTG